MGFFVYLAPTEIQYDTLKHSLVIDDPWADRGSASFSAKNVASIVAAMPVKIGCVTTASLTFGGSVRGWSTIRRRGVEGVQHDIDVDDWRPYLDRRRPCRTYTSIAINSIVRDLVTTYTSSFSAAGIHSMMSEAGSLTWTRATVAYHHDVPLSDAITSLTAMASPPDVYAPPVWGVTPDRVVHLVGSGNSYGTTIVVDDTDLTLRTLEMAEVGNKISTRTYIWGGSATVVTSLAAGGTSLRTYQNEVFWGPSSVWTYPTASLYVTTGTELIPVISVPTLTGDATCAVSTLNLDGATHAGAPINAVVRAVLVQTAATAIVNSVGSITGESGIWESHYDAYAQAWPTNPIILNSIATMTHQLPGTELVLMRLTTTNSQVASGGRMHIKLTAAGVRQGIYPIQRVRITGFDRGESLAPIYEVEAGTQPRFRVDSLLSASSPTVTFRWAPAVP